MLKCWEFHLDCGRDGEICSTFLATDDMINSWENKMIYMTDVLGKHSEICINFTKDYLKEIKLSETTINELHITFGKLIGGWFYPEYYFDEEEE